MPISLNPRRIAIGVATIGVGARCLAGPTAAVRPGALPLLEEALKSQTDVWGEAAMRQPNGASYRFFEKLLPPPRYVHADFKYYPLVLSAPGARVKARLISDGSGINLRGGSRSWKDAGVPIRFRVGPDEFRFGGIPDRLSEPIPAEGWLPIYQISYRHAFPVQSEGMVPLNHEFKKRPHEVYRLEAFCSTQPELAESAVVCVKFDLAVGARGIISAEIDLPAGSRLENGALHDAGGKVVAFAGPEWKMDRGALRANLQPGGAAVLAIPTRSLAGPPPVVSDAWYAAQRSQCAATWKGLLARGMQIETPEEVVNRAWKSSVMQTHALLNGDRIFYSAGNQYESLYEAEGSDAALTMMTWGYEDEFRRMLPPLLDFSRRGLEAHQAGTKLMNLSRYFWHTRDAEYLKSIRPKFESEIRLLLNGRDRENGLYPKERYCSDISTPVHSLSVAAKAWRGLRDLPPVLQAMGDPDGARRAEAGARELRRSLDAALAKSIRREVQPPFVPMALLADEPVHSPILGSRIGSYWNIICGYVIASRLFPTGTPEDEMLPRFQERHGGVFMGMLRSGATDHAFWTGADRVNPLYGTRYTLDTLRRDDPERALVSFYGMLAQGFTRETFVVGEGCTLRPVDAQGRFFYCPPNSAGSAHFLSMLRNLLVQDADLNGDGEPETLRLLFATPKRWLEDGKRIELKGAPTAFGPVSVEARSNLAQGTVTASVALPSRQVPARTVLRLRVPEGWRVSGAETSGKRLGVDGMGTLDLTGLQGSVVIRCRVERVKGE